QDYPVEYNVAGANDSIYAFGESGIFVYSPAEDAFISYKNTEKKITEDRKYKYILSDVNYPLILADDGWIFLDSSLPHLEQTESIMRLFDDPGFISIDENRSIWLADSKNNIHRIEPVRKDSQETEFIMYISGVRSDDRSFHEFDNMIFEPGKQRILVNISAPYYLKKTSTRYQYLIEGYMKKWSEWTINPELAFPLEAGDYTVHFRAMNVLGEISEEKTIRFSIKPPFTQSVLFYVLMGLLVTGFFVLVIIFREKKLKHDKRVLEEKVRQRTLEIEQKKQQIEIQRDEIMNQKEEITSSIAYASRIQSAMLSGRQLFKNSFRDYFIMFKPRDIVSGDFYWIAGNKDRVYFTAADCTGHGVPGAFMSMLGISLLNEITSDGEKNFRPSEILELMRSRVINSLSHASVEHKAVDGIDLAFCKYDRKRKVLEYAGAFNPLYHFREGELTEYKANRMPVGSYTPSARTFTNNELQIKAGDVIYIFSDGFTDQFGGPENKKYSTRRFKQTLAEVVEMPMKKQHEILRKKFAEWKGETSQLDDIILIGIRF
ncbi:MAG: PP2C family protein-serine/threonine phosphatase, partial [Bacteroidota bacterium]